PPPSAVPAGLRQLRSRHPRPRCRAPRRRLRRLERPRVRSLPSDRARRDRGALRPPMRYQVTVGDRRLDVDVDGARVTVDGVECHAELRSLPGTPLRQLALDARSYVFLIESRERGAWVLEAA